MTINFQDGSAGLFDVLGKLFYAMETITSAAGTTVRTELEDVVSPDDIDLKAIIANVAGVADRFDASAGASLSSLKQIAQDYLIEVVDADNPLSAKTYLAAITELRTQMIADSESFDASAVAVSVAAVGSPAGNGVLVATVERGDGLTQQTAYAETITVESTSDGLALFAVTGEPAVDLLSLSYPGGSGVSATLTAIAPSASLISGGGFDALNSVDSNLPSGWIGTVMQSGTTVKMTTPEQQTIAITGTPTSGYYLLHWTNGAGKAQTTDPISFDATASTIQSRLRAMSGLELVTVADSGTSPNLTHTVTFLGIGGDVGMISSTNRMDTGSIAHAETVTGTPQVFSGSYALLFDSDGSELTQLDTKITVAGETAYALNLWLTVAATAGSGVIQFSLVDGISGTVINDSQGNANTLTVNVSDLTTGWQSLDELVSGEPIFRLPAVVPSQVYLRMRFSTAPPNGTKVFFDHMAMQAMTVLYPGGPLAAMFAGSAANRVGDTYAITVTNDRAGKLHEWMARTFDLATNQILLPVDSGGSETIPDSVVS